MSGADAVRQHFLSQADACARLGSSFTAALCRALAVNLDDGSRTGTRVLNWPGSPGEDALALRLCGALHALVLENSDEDLRRVYPPRSHDPSDLAATLKPAISRHDTFLSAALDGAPQTNETARSAMLLPGFLEIARLSGQALEICEIGSSAGLNLLPDHYRYRFGTRDWGNNRFPVVLAPDGDVPLPSDRLSIADRCGCDLSPADIRDAAHVRRLKSYIWPDQPGRMARLDAAVAAARRVTFRLERSDAADFVSARLSARTPGRAFVLFHSVVWQYLARETRAAIEKSIRAAGHAATPSRPLFWLRMEPGDPAPHAELRLTCWPAGGTRVLAECDFHGRWIRWIDRPG